LLSKRRRKEEKSAILNLEIGLKQAEKSYLSQEKSLEQAYEAHEKSGGDPKVIG